MGNLGVRSAIGVASTQNLFTPGTSLWVCTFGVNNLPRDQDFEIYHGSAEGPGGYFKVYLDQDFYGAGQNGIINEYNPRTAAMFVRKGQTITVVWSIGTGAAPTVRFWMRTPEVGRV